MLTEKLWHMAQIGAEWVLYLLIILSVISIAVMIERALYFWRAKADLETTDVSQRKLLHMASKWGHMGVAQLLLDGQANLEAEDVLDWSQANSAKYSLW